MKYECRIVKYDEARFALNVKMAPFRAAGYRISWDPKQMNGQPCIRGMRLTVRRVVEAAALYPERDDLFSNYPELEPDDLRQVRLRRR